MPPANDDFANRITLSGASGTWTGNSDTATSETGEPSPFAGSGGASIWFEWTAPFTGTAQFDTLGSTYTGTSTDLDTVVDVFTGTAITALTLVDGNDDDLYANTVNSLLRVAVTSGTTYVIRVDGYAGDTGDVVLHWLHYIAPPAPTVTSISPGSGISGDTVVITGTDFTDVTKVQFRKINPTVANEWAFNNTWTVDSSTQITAVVPGTTGGGFAAAGPVRVTTASGSGWGGFFEVTSTIGVASISPAAAPAGAEVTVTGYGFTGISGGGGQLWLLDLAGAPDYYGQGAPTVDSDTQVRFIVGSGLPVGSPLRISLFDGSSQEFWSIQEFTATGSPAITSFTPSHAAVGATVTITGTGFTGTTSVEFNGQPGSYTVNSDTQITATVPAGASTGLIVVTNPAGNDTSATDFTVDLPAPGTLGVGELVFVGGHHAVSRTTTVTLTTPVDIDDGDLIVVALLLDDPTASGGISTGTFSNLEGFTPHVGYGWIMWLGYQFWHTGDPTSYSFTTSDPAAGVLACFRGVDPTVTPDGAIRAQSGTGLQTVTFSETGDLGNPRRTALYIAAGVLYGQSTGLVPRSPLVSPSVLHAGDPAGSNFALSGKELRVGYQLTQPAGTVGPYYFDGYTGVTSDEAEALCGLFVSTARGGWTVGSISI